ncbi:MAG: hypothetical protein K2X29_01200 [Candidatus Obscuribacterales bacterium]|nr:hypothetical protein [Candidatus Obscuribacterales bacterium]
MRNQKQTRVSYLALSTLLLSLGFDSAALAQSTPPQNQQNTDQQLSVQQQAVDRMIAELPTLDSGRFAPVNPTVLPTDVNPEMFSGERSMLSRDLQYSILKRLPSRMWFNMVTEASQRLETNVFFTKNKPRQDYVFRILPNISLGYNLLKATAVYCNWFLIKDVFADHTQLSAPTTQSLSLGFRQDVPIFKKTNLQFDFQARELWQASHFRQADLLPAINLTQIVKPNLVLFGSSLLQLRSHYYFQGATREIDPFWSWGFLYRRGQWNFTATSTYVANFRKRTAIPPINNQSMICDFELSRPISSKAPGVVTFIRAEPVWNWGAPGNPPGLSGFDFRLFGGIRVAVNKPAYNSTVEFLRKQIMEQEEAPPQENKPKETSELSPPPMTDAHGPLSISMTPENSIHGLLL